MYTSSLRPAQPRTTLPSHRRSRKLPRALQYQALGRMPAPLRGRGGRWDVYGPVRLWTEHPLYPVESEIHVNFYSNLPVFRTRQRIASGVFGLGGVRAGRAQPGQLLREPEIGRA